MRDHRRGLSMVLSWVLPAFLVAAVPACAPGGPDEAGEAAQAAEGDEDGGDGDAPDKDDPGSCGGDPGPECTGASVGDGTACLDDAALLAGAQAACDAVGFVAVGIYPTFDCGGNGSTFAKVWCCAEGEPGEVPPQPPDPGPPPAGALGDGVTCLEDAEYLQLAEDTCAAMGLSLLDLYPLHDCPGGASTDAKYVCG